MHGLMVGDRAGPGRPTGSRRSRCRTPRRRSPSGRPVSEAASAVVEDPDLCPRLTVSVLTDVVVGPSPQWIAAAADPGRHAAHQQRRRRIELRDARAGPAHASVRPGAPRRPGPDRPAAPGRVRRSTRSMASPGRWVCPVAVWATPARTASSVTATTWPSVWRGSWVAPRRRSPATTTEVLLEAAYFTPMAIARTSKRLGLRTEASARFERGCDPWGIDAAVNRFVELLAESVPGLKVCDGLLDVRGDVPEPFTLDVPIARVQRQIGVALTGDEIAALLDPIGFTTGVGGRARLDGARAHEPARCAPGALWDRRRDRGGGPDVRVRQRSPAHADLAPTRPSHLPAAVAPAGRRACWRVSVPPRAGPIPSFRRSRIAGWA